MIFLENKDLETQLFEDYIDESVQEDMEALDQIEKQAIAFVKSKLRSRYDVAIIFSTAVYGDKDLIKWAVTGIVVYRMIRRNAARKVPSDFVKDYDDVKEWLKGILEGTENPDLPKVIEPEFKQVQWGNSTNKDLYF